MSATAGAIRPCFVDAGDRRIFIQRRDPPRATGECVLIVPPFAEEMNKSRKMLTEVARGLNARAITTVLPDLSGTGDSELDFGASSWRLWKDDLARTADWCRSQGLTIRGLLGVRLGCALAAEVASDLLADLRRSVMWQPVASGATFLVQFLRLRVAANMMDAQRKESVESLRTALREGQTIEVAGYDISPALAAELDSVRLDQALTPRLGELHLMEVVRNAEARASAASERLIEQARERGIAVTAHLIEGEAYWSTTEIVRIERLVATSVEVLAGTAAGSAGAN